MPEGVFEPRLSVLPVAQRRLWDELGTLPRDFVLYGGTALALHLGHRTSVDFDFFSQKSFDPVRLAAEIPFLDGAAITQQEANTLSVVVDRGEPVKVSFFGVPALARLLPPHLVAGNGSRVASLLDLAGTKVAVVQQRAEAKDYIDIDALLQDGRIDLGAALGAARAIYGQKFNPQITLKALAFFGDGNLSRLPRDLCDRLAGAVRKVDLDRLPDLAKNRDTGGLER